MKFIGAHIFDYDATFRGDVTIEGNLTISNSVSQTISFGDNDSLYFGNSNDLQIVHDSANSKIENSTGQLTILNTSDDKDIVFRTDDGGGGVTDYVRIDGSHTRTKFDKKILVADGEYVGLGDGADLQIMHNGTNTLIDNITGDVFIRQFADNKDIKFSCDDGSGGTTEYLRIDGASEKTFYSKPILLFDSVALQLGTDTDATLFHSGGEGTLQNFTGNFRIIQGQDDGDIQFFCDDGSGGVTEYLRLDGGAELVDFSKGALFNTGSYLKLNDNITAFFGAGNDLRIYHDGNNSYISQEGVGDLYIRNTVNDRDIYFQSDDGSGGNAIYFYLDGSTTDVRFDKSIRVTDSQKVKLGTGEDLQLYHNGTDSFVDNITGDLKIRNFADDKDIIFQSDDGSGGVETYFFLDGNAGGANPTTIFPDNSRLAIGSGQDLKLYHSPSISYIDIANGDFKIRQTTDDGDIIFQCDDGSGGLADYITIDGGETRTTFNKNARFNDDVFLQIGSSADLYLVHSSGDSSIVNGVGDLYIKNAADDKDIIFQCDDGSGGVETYFFLDGNTGQTRFPDNKILAIGSGGDLQIHHDSNHSYITQGTTGALFIRQTVNDQDIILQCDDGSGGLADYIRLDGSAERTIFSKSIVLSDSVEAIFGTGLDFKIKHTSVNTELENNTGNLTFINNADDKDIKFFCDDGSGGTTAYITLDGSETEIHLHKTVGIGTTNPDTNYKLDVAGKVQVQSVLELDDVLTLNAISTPADPGTNQSSIYMDSADGAIRVKINVGGTTVTRTLATFE